MTIADLRGKANAAIAIYVEVADGQRLAAQLEEATRRREAGEAEWRRIIDGL